MARIVLVDSVSTARVSRVLDALGVVHERTELQAALPSPKPTLGPHILVLADEDLVRLRAARRGAMAASFAPYTHVLIYPFHGSEDALRAVAETIAGEVEVHRLARRQGLRYSVTSEFAAAGPFARLDVPAPADAVDLGLVLRSLTFRTDTIIGIGDHGLLTRVMLGDTELFVLSSPSVFDVDAETVHNLDASARFAQLVPLLSFLRHAGVPFWRTDYPAANVIIDDLNLRPTYGFVDTRTLASEVDDRRCAITIAFIPWNCRRTSRDIVDLFRARWPRLSLAIHGCDHVGAEFTTASVEATRPLVHSSLARMEALRQATGMRYDKVMVFPQGRFSQAAMDALRHSDFLAAVNTEVADDDTRRGVRGAELLQPAVTAYAGFPLFLRRTLSEPIANFALDLLLGKPCLVVTHHDDFRLGLEPLASLVAALNRLEPRLRWTNLGSIVGHTYATRAGQGTSLDVRLFASDTIVRPHGGEMQFSKAEPLTQTDFGVRVDNRSVTARREGADLVFRGTIAGPNDAIVQVRSSIPESVVSPGARVCYRGKVAARRWLSEFRDNYVARSSWATSAVKAFRGTLSMPERR